VTGWSAVAATGGLVAVALLGLNVRLYRRSRAAIAEGYRRQAESERSPSVPESSEG
jgi:hypothetical protein